MIRRRMRLGATLMGCLLAFGVGASYIPTARADEPETTWLALGDSFSSGEGLKGVRGDCQRAGLLKKSDKSKQQAWSVVAWQNLRQRYWLAEGPFVPCSGAIVDDYADQLQQAKRSGDSKWDVVTLSFGGNSVDFPGVIGGCVDFSKSWDLADLTPGCDVPLATLKQRIDLLAADKLPSNTNNRHGYVGKKTLRQALTDIRRHVKPGGRVVVAGYPALIETPSRWSFLQRLAPDKPVIWSPLPGKQSPFANCNGVWEYDVPMLRAAGEYLNQVIQDEVDHQNSLWRPIDPNNASALTDPDGVTFAYADLAKKVYETGSDPEDRHGMCSKNPWVNNVQAVVQENKFRYQRMFHPNGQGQRASGEYVAKTFPNDSRNSRGWAVGPGSLGPLRIGMAVSDAIAKGYVRREVRHDDGCVAPYLDTTLGAPAEGDPPVRTKWEFNKLIWIAVRSDRFRTINGNQVGQPLDSVAGTVGPIEAGDFGGFRRVERKGKQFIIYYDRNYGEGPESDGLIDRIAMGTGSTNDLEPC